MAALGKIIATPTNDLPERVREDNQDFHHLMPHLRVGRISFEVFDRETVAKIPVDFDFELGGGKDDNARKEQKAAKVGVRGQGSEVGEEAPLQPDQAKAKEEVVKKARSRKKGSR